MTSETPDQDRPAESGPAEGGRVGDEPPESAPFLNVQALVPVVYDADTGAVHWVAPQCQRLLGRARSEWTRPGFWEEVVFADDQTLMNEVRRRAASTGGSIEVEYRMERGDGSITWVLELGVAQPTGSGATICSSFLFDLTERKRQEVALWKSEELHRAIVRLAPDAMVLTTLDGMIVSMNEQAESLLGYPSPEVTGSSIDHVAPPRLQPRLAELRDAFLLDPERRSLVDGRALTIERPDGGEAEVELSMSPVPGADGARRLLYALRDLSARRRATPPWPERQDVDPPTGAPPPTERGS